VLREREPRRRRGERACYVSTANGHLVALDATNGRKVWEQAFADVRAGESARAAPLVVKDLIIVGSSRAEYGVRGHIDAFDLATGARRWRRYNRVTKESRPWFESFMRRRGCRPLFS